MTLPALPPLPEKRRTFFCTKCGSSECRPRTAAFAHPECAKCEYLGFGRDCDYNDAETLAYGQQCRDEALEAAKVEIAAWRWGYEYLQNRMHSIERHGWAEDCDSEIDARIRALKTTPPHQSPKAEGDGT